VGKAGSTVERVKYVNGEKTTESIHLEGKFGEFVFVGCGNGNGLGLSYCGALEDIASGMSYVDVISKYYSGVKLS
jgi:peptidoglycan hydrolase-like amidase